jgi:hypothetical protein
MLQQLVAKGQKLHTLQKSVSKKKGKIQKLHTLLAKQKKLLKQARIQLQNAFSLAQGRPVQEAPTE